MTAGLIRTLDASERFHRDGVLGAIFHPGRVSYRELTPQDSLHIIIDGSHVSAHVDEVCPLRCTTGGAPGYSAVLVLAHNLAGSLADLGRRLRGLHGEQRCNLGCEIVWVDDAGVAELATEVREGRRPGPGDQAPRRGATPRTDPDSTSGDGPGGDVDQMS